MYYYTLMLPIIRRYKIQKLATRRALVLLVLCGISLVACDKHRDGKSAKQVPPLDNSVSQDFAGTLDLVSCETISGWAWSKNDPALRVKVEVYDEKGKLGIVSAQIYRKDLEDSGIGDGNYGFRFPTPLALRDGSRHMISAKIAGSGLLLRGSPKQLECTPPAPGR
jgi:hypothetical protein